MKRPRTLFENIASADRLIKKLNGLQGARMAQQHARAFGLLEEFGLMAPRGAIEQQMNEPELTYEQRIATVFRELCAQDPRGVSAFEVTKELERRGWLAGTDSVIDIADLMRSLRTRGQL